jgi:DNA adenine methylase
MISSYNSDLYNELYKDWKKIEFPKKKNNIRSSEVQEVIWINYENKSNDLFQQY